MASATDTATAEPAVRAAAYAKTAAAEASPAPAPPAEPPRGLDRRLAPRSRSGGRRWPLSPLTRRILAVNVLALALLAGGFLYLGKYQASLSASRSSR